MSPCRILIVDDEPLARERMRSILQTAPAAEIVGECTNGIDAIATIRHARPDIVFLDMQMPGRDGLQVVSELSPDERPIIVFVTAHDRFAVEAFGVHATDYLLKPFDRERLLLALRRATAQIEARRTSDLGSQIKALIVNATSPARKPGRLAFRTDGRIVLLEPAEIRWAEAVGNYVLLHLIDNSRLILRDTLSAIEERLGDVEFTRINRSAVVRIEQVKELQPTFHGDYTVILKDGTRLPLSRTQRNRLGVFGAEQT